MKKVVLALAVIATVACFSSCKKTCTCKTYADGQVVQTASEIELEKSFKNCSEMSTVVNFPGVGKTGMECE